MNGWNFGKWYGHEEVLEKSVEFHSAALGKTDQVQVWFSRA